MEKKDWLKGFLELIIIFVGVYAAFMLNNYRIQNNREQAQLKFYRTFLLDLKTSSKRIKALKKQVDKKITKIKNTESWEITYTRNLDLTGTYYILEAAYQDENFTAISTEFLVNIEFGANLIKQIEKRLNILSAAVRKFKIYHSESGSVARQKFKNWYKNELKFISRLLGMLINAIESDKGAIAGTKSMIEDLK